MSVNARNPPASRNSRRPASMRAASRSDSRRAPPARRAGASSYASSYSADETVDLRVGNGCDRVCEDVHAVAVDGDAQPNLRLDLVALGDRDLAHVVAEAGDLERLRLVPARGRTRPDAHARRDVRVAPVTDDRLPAQTHPRLEERELAVAVRRLVQVHEVHVDLGPRQIAVELRVEMEQRLLQRAQPGDPHLRRREGVHPCDHADARVRRVRVERGAPDRARARGDLPVHDAHRNVRLRVEAGGDLSRMRLDLPKRRRPVHLLAPGHEPDLEVSERVRRHRSRPPRVRLRKLEIISSVSSSSDVSRTGWSIVMRPPCMTLMRSQSSKRWA